MTKSQARKAAMDWLRASPLPWPAVGVYPNVGPANENGERIVRLGYMAYGNKFIRVVVLLFGDTTEPLFVSDRRAHKKTWPDEAMEKVA